MIASHLRQQGLLLTVCVAFLGCRAEKPAEHAHAHGEAAHDHGASGHDHGAGGHEHGAGGHDHGAGGPREAVTRWGAKTQLFVEFPALVVGQDSVFAAHLTDLARHTPLALGTLRVELRGGGAETERFAVQRPSVAGIFRPRVRPAIAGKRQILVRIEAQGLDETHDLGSFTVFAAPAAAVAAPREATGGGDDGDISVLLERQWQMPFGVERVEVRALRPSLSAFATLVLPPGHDITVRAPRGGRVLAPAEKPPRVGARIEAGATLLWLSMGPAEGADLASLDLAVEQADIAVAAAQREVGRLRALFAEGAVASRRVDEAQSALAGAEAARRAAQRQRAAIAGGTATGPIGDAIAVTSPMGGDVQELLVSPGAFVVQGQPLVRVVERDTLWLEVGVPEADVARVRDIAGVWFRPDGTDAVIDLPSGALIAVGAELDTARRTLPLRFGVDNADRRLFAGMAMLAHLVAAEPLFVDAVPIEAVVDDGGVDVVYVQTGGESFSRRPVRLGVRDGRYVELEQGVTAGEWVVTRGAWSVKLAATATSAVGHGHAH